MHVLNHVLTSRTRVQKHNRRIKELANSDGSGHAQLDEDAEHDKWRDQGYARPKVLVLLPTRGTCWTFVRHMTRLLGDAAQVDGEERFDQEYGPDEGSAEGDGARSSAARRAAVLQEKGAEWNELFGDGVHADDDFKLGVSLSVGARSSGQRKGRTAGGDGASRVTVKLFADFYHSDIILASPLGLQMATNGEGDGDGEATEADVDFLSSIDVCLVTRCDVLLMQNWDHLGVLDSLNRPPRQVADVDFSRVRRYLLNGHGARWRQLIMVSKFADPHILSTFRRHAQNIQVRASCGGGVVPILFAPLRL